jgi:hypothetical protein
MGHECPFCPQSFSGDYAEQAVAQHISQKQNHPPETYPEALKAVRYGEGVPDGDSPAGAEGTSASEGSESTSGLEGPATPESPESAPSLAFEDNPLFRMPVTDGGEAEAEDGDAEDGCPDCERPLSAVAAGQKVMGRREDGETVVIETEDGDEWCPACENYVVELDGEREVIR